MLWRKVQTLRDNSLATRQQAFGQLKTDLEFLELVEGSHTSQGLNRDEKEWDNGLDIEIFELMTLCPWLRIKMTSERNQWCID